MRRNLLTTTGPISPRTPRTLGGLALAAALLLGACSGTSDGGPAADGAVATSGADAAATGGDEAARSGGDPAAATVDTAALPDPVAEVDGAAISRADFVEVFEQQRAASQQEGQEGPGAMGELALRDAVLESLVSNELLAQEGERLGFEADDEAVDAEIEAIAEESGIGSSEEFLALLAEQGVDEEQVREEAARLLLVDRVLAEHGEVEPPTEEELQAYYEELGGGADGSGATGGAAGMPPFDDVRDILAQQLTQERETEAISTVLQELEERAEVIRHL